MSCPTLNRKRRWAIGCRSAARRAVAAGQAPDETTLCRFRASLEENGLARKVMDEIGRQLDAHDLILRIGTNIGASVVNAAVGQAAPREQALAA